MTLAEIEVGLPDDILAFIRSQVRSGRYAYVDEVITAALYLHMQVKAREGIATAESEAILEQPLEDLLSDLRRAIAAKRREEPPEILDIEQIADRWEEILARTEAGESFIISIQGQPKARLEPIPPDELSPVITPA